jgi:2-oxoglutarate ferredoxin oxidoreductase subunit alpha
MTREALDAGADFGRYLDVDGDGIPYRTYPGTHPTRAAISPAARPRTPTPATPKPAPTTSTTCSGCGGSSKPPSRWCRCRCSRRPYPARFAAIFYGSTSPAMHEALDALAEQGIYINALRVRAFPFQNEIADFIAAHSKVFVLEQNFDGN